jgi:hypothetical protein
MTPYYHAWLMLIQQRDSFYVQMFLAACVGLSWHWLGLKFVSPVIIARITLVVNALLVGLGLAWGFFAPK